MNCRIPHRYLWTVLAGLLIVSAPGAAKDVDAVVDFYDQRFGIGLTEDEKADLVAFLLTL